MADEADTIVGQKRVIQSRYSTFFLEQTVYALANCRIDAVSAYNDIAFIDIAFVDRVVRAVDLDAIVDVLDGQNSLVEDDLFSGNPTIKNLVEGRTRYDP